MGQQKSNYTPLPVLTYTQLSHWRTPVVPSTTQALAVTHSLQVWGHSYDFALASAATRLSD